MKELTDYFHSKKDDNPNWIVSVIGEKIVKYAVDHHDEIKKFIKEVHDYIDDKSMAKKVGALVFQRPEAVPVFQFYHAMCSDFKGMKDNKLPFAYMFLPNWLNSEIYSYKIFLFMAQF